MSIRASRLIRTLADVASVGALDEPVGAVHGAGDLGPGARRCGLGGSSTWTLPGAGAHADVAPEAVLQESVRAMQQAAIGGAVDRFASPRPPLAAGAARAAGPPRSVLTLARRAPCLVGDARLGESTGRRALERGTVGIGHTGANGTPVFRHETVGTGLATGARTGGAGGGMPAYVRCCCWRCCLSRWSARAAAMHAFARCLESVRVTPATPVDERLTLAGSAVEKVARYVRTTHASLGGHGTNIVTRYRQSRSKWISSVASRTQQNGCQCY